MRSHLPAVMVSSTYYDLKQVRSDLRDFIANDLGYTPLISEYDSFPVDPDLDTIENCRRRVEHDVDVFVLIIGGRYGTVDAKTKKSITNLEYITARAGGLPCFVFAEREVLTALGIWRKNQSADFSPGIPDARLFGFLAGC